MLRPDKARRVADIYNNMLLSGIEERAARSALAQSMGVSERTIGDYLSYARRIQRSDNDIKALAERLMREKGRVEGRAYNESDYTRAIYDGPHVTLALGDQHLTDEDCLYDTYISVVEKAVKRIAELRPGRVDVLELGDMISGEGIFRGQQVRNITNHLHWQTLVGAHELWKLSKMIEDGSGLVPRIFYIKGNHDEARSSGGNLARPLCNEAAATFGIPVKYCGTEFVFDLGDKAHHYALCVHGYGGSRYHPQSNAFLDAMHRRVANLNVKRSPEEAIMRVIHGHVHWMNVGFEYTRTLTFDTVGGMQRNKRPELGQVQRPTGAILYVAEGDSLRAEAIKPDDNIFEEEIASVDLEFRNIRRVADILQDSLVGV